MASPRRRIRSGSIGPCIDHTTTSTPASKNGSAIAVNSATPAPDATAASTAPHTVLTVRDMLVDRTMAAAVMTAEQEKQHRLLASANSLLPEGLIAVTESDRRLPRLSPAEVAAVTDTVDLTSVGIAG